MPKIKDFEERRKRGEFENRRSDHGLVKATGELKRTAEDAAKRGKFGEHAERGVRLLRGDYKDKS